MKRKVRHGSLFSGIGGFDLAAEWCGWRNIFNCEIDPFCRRVLNYHFPKAKSYEDIKKTDFSKYEGKIDVLSGGFPCQPFSVAGRRRGKEDERYLWPQMLRTVQQVRPKWVVAENVLGITSWNNGMVFEQVWSDLEDQGYSVQPYIIPAAAVGAPHRRDRVWFVGSQATQFPEGRQEGKLPERFCIPQALDRFVPHPIGFGCGDRGDNWEERHLPDNGRLAEKGQPEWQGRECGPCQAGIVMGNPDSRAAQNLRTQQSGNGKKNKERASTGPEYAGVHDHWADWPTESPICLPYDGVSYRLDADTVFEGIPFPVKPISFPKWRMESIKAFGNAIVPQVALRIFRTIQKMIDCKL